MWPGKAGIADDMMTRKKRLVCDVCGKPQSFLMGNEDSQWKTCNNCFEKADALAALQDRWPEDADYQYLKKLQT